jgi:hypothetical protein
MLLVGGKSVIAWIYPYTTLVQDAREHSFLLLL